MSKHGSCRHAPCPKCGSSDALAVYASGYFKCFSAGCNYYGYSKDGSTSVNISDSDTAQAPQPLVKVDSSNFQELADRGLSVSTCIDFQYMLMPDGSQVALYVGKDGSPIGQKVRYPGKQFRWLGDIENAMPYGYPLWKKAHTTLIIAEGEIDTMSVYQAIGSGAAVMGLPNGAGPQSKRFIEKNLNLFEQFDKIYIGLDNDEAGKLATADLVDLFADREVRVITWRHKDPNDSLQLERPKEIVDAVQQAKAPQVDDIIDVSTFNVDRLYESFKPGIPLNRFPKLAMMLKWLRPGNIYTIAAAPKAGKEQPLTSLIPTPNGFTAMGDLQVGDIVFDHAGRRSKILAKSDVRIPEKAYRLHFSNGSSVDCSDTHDWEIFTRTNIRTGSDPAKRNTSWILENYKSPKGRSILYVKNPGAVEFDKTNLPINPYTLGVWLGDGCSVDSTIYLEDRKKIVEERILSLEDGYIVHRRNNCNKIRINGIKDALKSLDLFENKHIPEQYLIASIADRLDLLRGLIDTDGSLHTTKVASYEITQKRLPLIQGIQRLLWSLGIKAHIKEKSVKGVMYYSISFTSNLDEPVSFRLQAGVSIDKSHLYHTIVKVAEIEPEPMQCIVVDNPSHTYLTGHGFITTHNSTFTRVLAHSLIDSGYPVGMMYLEDEEEEVIKYLISHKTGIPIWEMEQDLDVLGGRENIKNILDSYKDKGLYIYDHDGHFDPDRILSKLKYMARALKCSVVIFDNFSISTSILGEDLASTNQFVTQLVQLCKSTGLILINICHLKKNLAKDRETGEDSIIVSPSDVYGTGALNKFSTALIALEKPFESTYATLKVLSNRYGPTGYADVLTYNHTTGQLSVK